MNWHITQWETYTTVSNMRHVGMWRNSGVVSRASLAMITRRWRRVPLTHTNAIYRLSHQNVNQLFDF